MGEREKVEKSPHITIFSFHLHDFCLPLSQTLDVITSPFMNCSYLEDWNSIIFHNEHVSHIAASCYCWKKNH